MIENIQDWWNNINNIEITWKDKVRFFFERLWCNQKLSVLKDILILKLYGFKPLKYTLMFFEDTFIFKTQREADIAFKKFEENRYLLNGWWYGEKEFKKDSEDYCNYSKCKLKIINTNRWSDVIRYYWNRHTYMNDSRIQINKE